MQDNDWNGFKEKMGKRNVRTDIDHAQKEEMGQSPEGWCGFVCVCVRERERMRSQLSSHVFPPLSSLAASTLCS